jgi:hypothetical protein
MGEREDCSIQTTTTTTTSHKIAPFLAHESSEGHFSQRHGERVRDVPQLLDLPQPQVQRGLEHGVGGRAVLGDQGLELAHEEQPAPHGVRVGLVGGGGCGGGGAPRAAAVVGQAEGGHRGVVVDVVVQVHLDAHRVCAHRGLQRRRNKRNGG